MKIQIFIRNIFFKISLKDTFLKRILKQINNNNNEWSPDNMLKNKIQKTVIIIEIIMESNNPIKIMKIFG